MTERRNSIFAGLAFGFLFWSLFGFIDALSRLRFKDKILIDFNIFATLLYKKLEMECLFLSVLQQLTEKYLAFLVRWSK